MALLILAACSLPAPIASQGGPVKDQTSLIAALRARGLTVEIGDAIEQPFLSVEGTTLRVQGGSLSQAAELQVFNYDDTNLQADGLQIAADEASQIEASGQPKTMRIAWMAPPHFYRQARLICRRNSRAVRDSCAALRGHRDDPSGP